MQAYGSSKLPAGELTALHIAAERGSAEMVRLLVAAGGKVNTQGDKGMPPLHVAVWEGNTAAVVALLAAKVRACAHHVCACACVCNMLPMCAQVSAALESKAGGLTALRCMKVDETTTS